MQMALFGSVLRDDFGPESDVDVLVSFAPDARWSLFDLVAMQNELKTTVGREVDLVERSAVEQSENYISIVSIVTLSITSPGKSGAACGSRRVIPFTTSIPSTTCPKMV